MVRAPLLFEEATNADGVWRLVVRSSDGVVGHIFRTVDEYGYFAGRFNALTITFRDSNLERLKKRIVARRRMDARRRDGLVAKRRAR